MPDPTAAHTASSTAVNMADVARRAGVSTATVSRALRDVPGVSAGTRARVRAIADELAYVISPEASRLARGATGRVAVVVPKLDVWFHSSMLASVEATLFEANLDVLVYQVDGVEQRGRFFHDLPARRKVDALVMIALPLLHDEAERLDLLGVHVVVAGGRLRDYPHVQTDDHRVGCTAVEHLLQLGHRRIAMIRTSDSAGTALLSDRERTRGYRDALADAGIAFRDEYLVTVPYGVGAGAEGIDRLLALDEPPTAVFAYSDEIAISALHRLLAHGLRVPEDVSLVGVDGHPLGQVCGLDTVSQAVTVQGRTAGGMVLSLLRGEPLADGGAVVVPPELLQRGSTAPPPS